MKPVKCGVADPQELDRKALVALLETQPDLRVGCEAATAAEVAVACRQKRIDLAILDVRAPGADGKSVVRLVRDLCPATPILALVRERGQLCMVPGTREISVAGPRPCPCRGQADCIGQVILDGARCVVPRSAGPTRFFRAIRRVARRRPCFPSEGIRSMVECAVRTRDVEPARALTLRERQIASLIAGGYCNKEIGEQLHVAVATVKKHVGHVLAKLHMHDRLQIGLLMANAPLRPGRDAPDNSARSPSGVTPASRPPGRRILPK